MKSLVGKLSVQWKILSLRHGLGKNISQVNNNAAGYKKSGRSV
jgi:hypothetical protein